MRQERCAALPLLLFLCAFLLLAQEMIAKPVEPKSRIVKPVRARDAFYSPRWKAPSCGWMAFLASARAFFVESCAKAKQRAIICMEQINALDSVRQRLDLDDDCKKRSLPARKPLVFSLDAGS